MFVRVHLPVMIDGRIQSNPIIAVSDTQGAKLIKAGEAEPDPYLDALKQKARALGQNPDWPYPERRAIQVFFLCKGLAGKHRHAGGKFRPESYNTATAWLS